MPSEAWKIKNFKQKWYAGETISVGIGQGAVAVTPIQLARAIGAITSDGVLHRPHSVFPSELPSQYKPASYEQSTTLPIDPQNWETITDSMARVPTVEGTAPSAHLEGIDFAGKTGSAQTMSNALAQRLGHKHSVKDNAWFVGVTPRRNPEIVVAVLYEGGEHGQFAARIAAQVIKAYVTKQRNRPVKVAAAAPGLQDAPVASEAVLAAAESGDKLVPATQRRELLAQTSPRGNNERPCGSGLRPECAGQRPAPPLPSDDSVEVAGFWGARDDSMHGARFRVKLGRPRAPIAAAVAR
jgi:penicillin-binding protein 2